MLTNNKKSYFVKSIAMIMAVLMVLAVCLTGCGKAAEEAATKAENAQNAADKAQTDATAAQTAADAVKASLADYLLKADAVTVDAVNAAIVAALGDYAKTADLADFVKSGKLTELSNQLANYVKTADLAAKVKEAVGEYVKPADLTAVENSLKTLITAADGKAATVKAEIEETLKGYVKAADLKAATDKVAALETTVAGLQTQINTLSEKIGTDITAALVTYATKAEVEALGNRLNKLEDVVRAILDAFYTKEEIETLEGSAFEDLLDLPAEAITVLIQDKMSLNEWNKTTPVVIETIDNIQTLLGKIYNDAKDGLRDAYTTAAKKEINGYLAPLNIVMFDANNALTSYNKNAKNLEYTILRVATLAELTALKDAIAKANAVKTFDDELKALYAEKLFTIGDEHTATTPKDLKVQTVTIANKGEINAFVEAYDNLIIKYRNDNAFANTIYAATYGAQALNTVWTHPTTGKQVVAAADATKYETTENNATVTWTKAGTTILVAAAGTEWKKVDTYGLIYLPTDIDALDWANGETVVAKIDGNYGSKEDLVVAKTFKDAAGTLKAVVEQTYDAQDLVNAANEIVAAFLKDVVKANGTIKDGAQDKKLADVTNPTDAQYLEALTVGMCTPVVDGPVYSAYLLTDVATAVNAALARNTCKDADDKAQTHTDVLKAAITKYDLYFQMIDKAWDLVFELYRTYAQQMLTTILYDYISVVDNFKAATADVAVNATELAVTDGFLASYQFANKLTDGFLAAFLNGSTFAGWTSSKAGAQAAIAITKDFKNTALVNYYGDVNGLVMVADPAATIVEYDEELRLYLTSAVQNVFVAIRTADLAAAKAENRNDVAGVFKKLLNEAVANLDEVYNRFLFEDYKADKLNETYAFATETAVLFSGYADTALIEAMEHYLAGTSKTTGTTPAADVTANKLFPTETSLVNASMTTEFKATTVNKFDKIDGVSTVAKTATNAMAAINDRVTFYETKLENMAIKDNFLAYLDTATVNVARAYLDYMATAGLTYDMINKLVAERNMADTTITVKKFQEQMGTIALDNYKAEYTDLLNLIAGKAQEAHLEYLTGKTFAKALEAVKSSDTTKTYATGINNVVRPVDALNAGTDAYYGYVGSTIVNFDEVVNVNTKWADGKNADGTTKWVNLY